MLLNYQRSGSRGTITVVRVACMDVACEQALPLGESREAEREQHAKEDVSVRGGEREEEFSFLHSIDLSNFF